MANSLPRLVIVDASGNDREVEITRTPFTLGRQTDNDLVLLDNRISRRHARIIQREDTYFLEDWESRHGTYLNGERVSCRGLKSGDQIGLGVLDAYQISFIAEQSGIPILLERLEKSTEEASQPGRQRLQHLGLLLQMAQMLTSAPALEEVLTTLVDSALQLTDAERGLLFLRDDNGRLQLRLARGRGGIHLVANLSDYSNVVVERVAASGHEEILLEEEKTGRTALETGTIGTGMRGVVAVPLQKLPVMESRGGETIRQVAPELLGVLYLESRMRATSLTGLDRQVLQTLAMEGATVIENARLFRLTREQERIQHELALARSIQEGLLPRELPRSNYFELYATTMPSRTVGGDYYDVISLPGERYAFAVADVSGKGLGAAMMAATLQGAFAAVAAGAPALEDLFLRVNDFLCERTPSDMFATMFYGLLNSSGRLSFVSAGHPRALILRANGSVDTLDNQNIPMGILSDTPFAVDTALMQNGDTLVIYSDGVTEAQDISGRFFGEDHLVTLLNGRMGLRAEELGREVIARVNEFAGGAPQADDLTLVVIRFGAHSGGE